MSDQPSHTVYHQTPAGLVAVGQTNVGKIRQANEDSLLIITEPPALPDVQIIAAVADGMGGHVGGAIASSTAVDSLEQYIRNLPGSANLPTSLAETLEQAIKDANQAIQSQAAKKGLHGMGTTLTAAMVGTTSAVIANVGDSRAYLLRNGSLDQITEDHSLVGEQVRKGLLPKEALETHPQRNILTRALGNAPQVVVDIFHVELEPADTILLCSDGLYPVVEHKDIGMMLSNNTSQDACRHLIEAANTRGGPDNTTVIIIQVPHG